jgi:hypothetical protein
MFDVFPLFHAGPEAGAPFHLGNTPLKGIRGVESSNCGHLKQRISKKPRL